MIKYPADLDAWAEAHKFQIQDVKEYALDPASFHFKGLDDKEREQQGLYIIGKRDVVIFSYPSKWSTE